MKKLLEDALADEAAIFVWTETGVQGEELDALRAHIRTTFGKEWDTAVTPTYITGKGREAGGVIIAWNTEVFKRETKEKVGSYGQDAETDEVEKTRGRVARVRLTAIECGARLNMVGAYAPTRGAATAKATEGEDSGPEIGFPPEY